MDTLSITAASGLRSRLESLDLLANNLANAATAGYKKDAESYSLYLSPAALDDGAGEDPATSTLPVIERRWSDFSQGVLESTGNPLDLALSGEGFFVVQGSQGALYTRNGHFVLTARGELTTADGYAVRLSDGTTPQLDPSRPVRIADDGTISQDGVDLGQLAVVRFATPQGLQKVAGTYYSTGQTPLAAAGTSIVQGRVEGSNVSAPESSERLLDVMRQFEMLTKVVQMNADMHKKATDEVARPVA
jgi:flagellar basal body rod protein FlgG